MPKKPNRAAIPGDCVLSRVKVAPWVKRKIEISVQRRRDAGDDTFVVAKWMREAFNEKLVKEFGPGLKSPDNEK